jgi:hypothetical protein
MTQPAIHQNYPKMAMKMSAAMAYNENGRISPLAES